jgi:hypothetical protein
MEQAEYTLGGESAKSPPKGQGWEKGWEKRIDFFLRSILSF